MALPQRPLRRIFLVATLGFACQPGRAATEQELGEDVVLTADAPVAALEVTLCMTGGTPNGLAGYGNVFAEVSTNEGTAEFTLESLESEEDPYRETTSASATAERLNIALLTDRDWEADGERCQQQVVQLSVPALEAGQTVTVSDLSVSFTAEWAGFCGPVPDDDNLSIAVERV